MDRFEDTYTCNVAEDDDDWGSDFERELCSQEIEDNKINEIREANLFQNIPHNVQEHTDDNSQIIQTETENRCVNSTQTGAIPKLGFSYLNTVNTDSSTGVSKTPRKVCRNNVHIQRQMSKVVSQSSNISMNSNNERQTNSNIEEITKKTPRKLKPEAFSFLNQIPQRNDIENGSDISKERKNLVPTAFSQAENRNIFQSQDDSNLLLNGTSDAFIDAIPSAPPLDNAPSNYESIEEEPFSEFALTPVSTISEENAKPPLPTRPPPVFKYPSDTFSSSITSVESSYNLVASDPISQSISVNPKLGHSVSLPDSGFKCTSVVTGVKMHSSKLRNRKSLPACAVAPTRPLPPLPISDTENVSKIKPHDSIVKLVSSDSQKDETWLESPTMPSISNQQINQFSKCEASIQHTRFKESDSEEQLNSNPQHRLAQILTTQTNVDSAVLISQKKIASAIMARAVGSQNVPISRFQNNEAPEFQNCGRPKEQRMIARRLENDEEQTRQVESEKSPYLEAKEVSNPRRFTDHESLINAMNRPLLPQKAAPIQRSVSCNSLVQGIKDLSFSVWSKPEKKRYSDGISLTKKTPKTTSLTSSSKGKPAAPLHIAIIPTDVPNKVNNFHHGRNDTSVLEEKSTLQDYPWFHDVDAKEGQLRLLSVGQDGTYLIRPSSRPTEDIQNTMCILYNGRVRNLHVRATADGRYALGSKTSKTFSSLTEIIRHHKENPVEILPQDSTQLKPQLYRILLRETPPKLKKLFV